MTNAESIVRKHHARHIEQAILNFDDRNRHGENKSPGWLRKACESQTPFDFRKGYVSPEQAKQAVAKVRKRNEMKAATETERRRAEDERAVNARKRVEEFLASLPSDKARKAFEEQAVKANKLIGKMYVEHQSAGGEKFDAYRQVLLQRAIAQRVKQCHSAEGHSRDQASLASRRGNGDRSS